MTIPIKKIIITDIIIDRTEALYVKDGLIKDKNVVWGSQPLVLVDPQTGYIKC